MGTGELQRAVDLIRIGDRHDTGDDRNGDARLADFIQEIVQKVVIKEHLRGQELAARIDLFLEETNVLLLIAALRVFLRVAGTADTEIRTAFLELADQIDGVMVGPGLLMRKVHIGRNVTAQRHDVFDAGRFDFFDLLMHGLLCR